MDVERQRRREGGRRKEGELSSFGISPDRKDGTLRGLLNFHPRKENHLQMPAAVAVPAAGGAAPAAGGQEPGQWDGVISSELPFLPSTPSRA